MGSCDYCGNGIALCCQIRSADGKEFIVGSDCVRKTGDRGLCREVDRDRRKLQVTREEGRINSMRERVESDADLRCMLSGKTHPQDWRHEQGESLLDSVEWMMRNAGHSGRINTVRRIEKLEKKALVE